MLEDTLFPAASDAGWRYWIYELFERGGRRRLPLAPIDLARFPSAR